MTKRRIIQMGKVEAIAERLYRIGEESAVGQYFTGRL